MLFLHTEIAAGPLSCESIAIGAIAPSGPLASHPKPLIPEAAMTTATTAPSKAQAAARSPLAAKAREAMEKLNAEAGHLNIWLRTQANAPAQQPWFTHTAVGESGRVAEGKVAAGQMKAMPYHWRWREISPYLDKIAEIAANAEVPPVEFAERQQFLLTNPGLGGRLQVASTIRCAVSIYNPGDLARAHLHSPNASRTILSETGGYTNVEGERCRAVRGDLILTPNGTWHDHGNDDDKPVVWIDTLDWPLLEFLDCIWLDEEVPPETLDPRANVPVQKTALPGGYSHRTYGQGGLLPKFITHNRGIGKGSTPNVHYRGEDIRAALDGLKAERGCPYEGIPLDIVNPVDGQPLFTTIGFGAQLLRPGEETRLKRETASVVYVVMEGRGQTEVAGRTFDWEENDIFVVPNFLWRRHINTGTKDAVIYTMSDQPLLTRIGQYRAQGTRKDGEVEQIVV
jgi:gentisate 1,2-dioxygenase